MVVTKKTKISDTNNQNYFPSWVCLKCHPTMLEEERNQISGCNNWHPNTECQNHQQIDATSAMPSLNANWMYRIVVVRRKLLLTVKLFGYFVISPFGRVKPYQFCCAELSRSAWNRPSPGWDQGTLRPHLFNQLIYALTIIYSHELWVIPCTCRYKSARWTVLSGSCVHLSRQDIRHSERTCSRSHCFSM